MRSSHFLVFSGPRSTIPKSAAPPNYDRWSNSHHGLAPDGDARRCLKRLVRDFAEEIFVVWSSSAVAVLWFMRLPLFGC
jgi:hypothetical protein